MKTIKELLNPVNVRYNAYSDGQCKTTNLRFRSKKQAKEWLKQQAQLLSLDPRVKCYLKENDKCLIAYGHGYGWSKAFTIEA